MNAPYCSLKPPPPAEGKEELQLLSQREVNRLAAKYAIAFLKTHLVGETGYQHMLTPGWARTREPNIEFFVTEPRNATSLGEDPSTFRYFLHPGVLSEPVKKDPE
jgi:hypothetical protein